MFWPINYSQDSPRFKPRFSYARVAMIDISESLVNFCYFPKVFYRKLFNVIYIKPETFSPVQKLFF